MAAAKFPTTLGDEPASNVADVTPSDVNDLPTCARGVYVGGAGDLVVDTIGGQTNKKFVAVPAGTILPVFVTRVRATGTTATFILALW